MAKGKISVSTENIFPIIKQFLYSDQEIFLRELIANATDATSKLKTMHSKGEFKGELGELKLEVKIDKEAKTLTISDHGIGMTQEEVKRYLNQVALSSAQEFVEKYQDDASVIGHFGLGFYSAFMVADKVEVITKSYQAEGDEATYWACEGDPSYQIKKAKREERGTDVILHISADSEQFLEDSEIEGLLNKYCKFLPFPIQFGMKTETFEVEAENEGDEPESKEIEVPNIINNPDPLWKKQPSELTDEDYVAFYKELHPFSPDPMFWIHLNIDYPFNLTGVLYFPKLGNALTDNQRNKISLYSNQVYVTDDVKEIVPEFLTLLHGVIDSPDIPLNVSRSYLQADGNVKKITGYITKKVADKLNELFKEDRKVYEEKWSDLGLFVKYGMITEDKFYDRAKKSALLKNTDGKFFTLAEYQERIAANQTDKHDKVIAIYTNNADVQHSPIQGAKDRGYDVLVLDQGMIDSPFIQTLERKEEGWTFVRVDSATPDQLVQKDEEIENLLGEEETEKVKELYTEIVGSNGTVEVKPLGTTDQVVQIVKPEFMRRMMEMQAMQGMDTSMFPDTYQVIVNANNPLVKERLLAEADEEARKEKADYLYKLALVSQQMLSGEELTKFVQRSLNRV
ncbi:molecular chaperone HtpG [Lewinellaceae bacterium SD302]|nr:molecular chaperone HtpG [Lewinellaceae bacterium SD302]